MKTKAAVAYSAGKPLEVTTVALSGPRTGEVLVHASMPAYRLTRRMWNPVAE